MQELVTSRAARHVIASPLDTFVAQMQAAAPFGHIEWEADTWDVTDAPQRSMRRSHDKKKYRLLFMNYDNESRTYYAFPRRYADFAKAIICQRHDARAQVPAVHRVSLRALRYLASALESDGKDNPKQLRVYHFHEAERLATVSEEGSSAYRVGQRLEEIANIVDRRSLTAVRIAYRCSLKRHKITANSAKMMSDAEIDAFGDLSAKIVLGKSPRRDVIRVRVIDLEVCTGLRIGEVLTLGEDPIVRDAEGFGLHYWPEKGGEFSIKRVPTPAIEIVERAVREISEACEPARIMAKWLHQNPGRVYFPAKTPQWLTCEKAASLIGCSKSAMTQLVQRQGISTSFRDKTRRRLQYISKPDLERVLAQMRDDRLVIDAPAHKQPLHKSLIVLFKHDMKPDALPLVNLVEHIDIQKMYYFLGIKNGSEASSAFKRYDINLPDGSYPEISPHRFRHWLDTLYRRGGLSAPEIARMFGRKRVDNVTYDHRTTAERAEEIRQAIREGKVAGKIVDAYNALPAKKREEFLRTQVTAALTTPSGGCIHDWAQSPCTLHLNCLSGCSEYTRTKGNARERIALEEQRRDTTQLLERARHEMEDGAYGANNWVIHLERQLKNIDAALAVDDDMFAKRGEKR